MSTKKKVGILGGSFNPVHLGHLNLAVSLKEACNLDEVLFVPAGLSPFKENAPPAVAGEHRLAMLKLAIASIGGFQVIDWELNSKGPSFTIDTVRKLSEDKTLDLRLLVGEDHFASFYRWKEAEELLRLAPPLVGSRGAEVKAGAGTLLKKLEEGRVTIPLFDISSTAVRERLLQKKFCGHLVPAAVLDYISLHRLYSRI